MEKQPTRKEILDALGAYQRVSVFDCDAEAFSHAFHSETDRAFIVIIGSVAEDILVEQILERFGEIPASLEKDLTRSGGALGTWAQQINLALAMGIITEQDAADFEVIKTMRNACAHCRQPIDFNTPQLRRALGLLLHPALADIECTDAARRLLRRLFALTADYLWGRLQNEEPEAAPIDRYTEFVQSLRSRAASPETQTQPPSEDANRGPQTQGQ